MDAKEPSPQAVLSRTFASLSGKICAGDIVGVYDSVFYSMLLCLEESAGKLDPATARFLKRQLDHCSRPSRDSPRPCVVLFVNSSEKDECLDEVTICPLATFGQSTYGSLIQILQHFVLPIGQNSDIPNGRRQLKTDPSWPYRHQWAVAWCYKRRRQDLIAWEFPWASNGRCTILAEDIAYLIDECKLRRETWLDHAAATPDSRQKMLKDIRVSLYFEMSGIEEFIFCQTQT